MNETNEKDEAVRESVHAIQGRLREFERGFKKAKGSMKKRLLKKLLKQVVVDSTGLHIFMSIAHEMEIPNHQLKLVNIRSSKDEKIPAFALTRKASGDDSNLSIFGSDIRKHGAPIRTRT